MKTLASMFALLIAMLPVAYFVVRAHNCGAHNWGMSLLRGFGAAFVGWLAAGFAVILAFIALAVVGGAKTTRGNGIPVLKPWASTAVILVFLATYAAVALALTRC